MKNMSDNNKQVQRVYKANNVQRRRFERMAEDLAARAKSVRGHVDRDKRLIIYKDIVKKAAGDDYKKLMHARHEIIRLKREIRAIREGMEPVLESLRDKGLRCPDLYSHDTGRKYYLDPACDEKKKDVCSQEVGDPTVQLSMFECDKNPLYQTYQKACEPVADRTREMHLDHEALVAKIWTLTTAEEIQDAIEAFKTKWECNNE